MPDIYIVKARRCALVLVASWFIGIGSASAQRVTGQWDFDAGDLSATVGANGQYWVKPPPVPTRDVAVETQFGTTTEFGIPDIDGVPAVVMKFPDCDALMGYAMYPEIDPNGGGASVNQYTIIMDILYPAASGNSWRALVQTADCNGNDADLFVNAANGIGISGQYQGAILPDTWHRVAFSFDLTTNTLLKFIDGILVNTQTLSSGVDGRWSLYPKAANRPALLFTDNDNETNVGYCNSIQIRDYAMSEAELVALGGASASGIPGGAGVKGQWDFDGRNLVATVGRDLAYFRGCSTCTQDLPALTQFGTTTSFGINDIAGEEAKVMRFPAVVNCTGYLSPHGASANGSVPPRSVAAETQFGTTTSFGIPDIGGVPAPVMKFPQCSANMGYAMYPEIDANGGGARVNQYTVIMDILFPSSSDLTWRGLLQAADCNDNDGEFFVSDTNGIGIGGAYDGTIAPDAWHRVAFSVDLAAGGFVKFIDGVQVGTGTSPLDGRHSLYAKTDNRPTLLFTDDNEETNAGYVSSIQVRNYAMTPAEIAALGPATATKIPGGAGVTGQWDFTGGDLSATIGRNLAYFNGCTPYTPKVNQYSLIMDVYFSDADYHAAGNWIALYQSNPMNAEDAMLWIRTTDGAIGDDGQYDPTSGTIFWDTWYRIAVVVDTVNDVVSKYVDGVLVGTQSASGIDGKRALWPRGSAAGDVLLLFTDDDDETKPGYVNSVQFRDYAMTEAEVAALGPAGAGGIPIPCATPPQDGDHDGDVDLVDFGLFQGCFNGPNRPYGGPAQDRWLCACMDADPNDGDVDLVDFSLFQACFNGPNRAPGC